MKTIMMMCCLALFVACAEHKTETPIKDEALNVKLDTLTIGKKICSIENLIDTSFVFEKFDFPEPSDSLNISKYNNSVSRNKDTLLLKCDNGLIVKLKDNRVDGDDYRVFNFANLNKDIHAYVVFCSLIEAGNVWLINKANGDSLQVLGHPVVSPNKKWFVCANSDIEAGFTLNGFELYAFNNNAYQLMGRRELSWGPEGVMWKNDTIVVFKAIDRTDVSMYNYSWKALSIK